MPAAQASSGADSSLQRLGRRDVSFGVKSRPRLTLKYESASPREADIERPDLKVCLGRELDTTDKRCVCPEYHVGVQWPLDRHFNSLFSTTDIASAVR